MDEVGIVVVSDEVAVACMPTFGSAVVGGISVTVGVDEGGPVIGEGNAVGDDCVIRIIKTTPITIVVKNPMIGRNSLSVF
jgi:hypothetical protein